MPFPFHRELEISKHQFHKPYPFVNMAARFDDHEITFTY